MHINKNIYTGIFMQRKEKDLPELIYDRQNMKVRSINRGECSVCRGIIENMEKYKSYRKEFKEFEGLKIKLRQKVELFQSIDHLQDELVRLVDSYKKLYARAENVKLLSKHSATAKIEQERKFLRAINRELREASKEVIIIKDNCKEDPLYFKPR